MNGTQITGGLGFGGLGSSAQSNLHARLNMAANSNGGLGGLNCNLGIGNGYQLDR